MKEPLRLPFVFLLVLLCVVVVLSALQLAETWGTEVSGAQAFSFAWAVRRAPRALFEVMAPAVILSIVLVGFRIARRPVSRLAGFLIVLVAGYLALANGMLWTHRGGGLAAGTAAGAPAVVGQYLEPAVFTRAGSAYVYPQSVTGNSLGPVLVALPSAPAPRLQLYRGGTAAVTGGEVDLRLGTGPAAQLRQRLEPAAAALFRPDAVTGLFLSDIRTCTADLERLLDASLPRFFVNCFALVFLVAASLAFLRLTRWPLANALLLALAVRGYFRLYHLLAVAAAPAIARSVADPLVAALVPAAAMIALGALLLVLDVVCIPADRWRQGAPE